MAKKTMCNDSPHKLVATTIVSKSLISLARVTANSFIQHHPGVPFFVLLADEDEGYLDYNSEPFCVLRLDQLNISELERLRFQYNELELSYALTPHLIEFLLKEGFDGVIFLKQETLVLNILTPLIQKMKKHSVVLTPHFLQPPITSSSFEWELNVLRAGIFNGGIIGVSNLSEALWFLDWWKKKTSRKCFRAVERGIHFEQRWLDFVPSMLQHYHILRDPGINVGHWNLKERRIRIQNDRVTASGMPCRLFRFSGYKPEHPEIVSKYNPHLKIKNTGDAAIIFLSYYNRLKSAHYDETSNWPYAFGKFDNGILIPDLVRKIYHDMGDVVRHFGDPFRTSSDSYFYWLNETAAPHNKKGLPNLWKTLWEQRPDLQDAFPEPEGNDRIPFLKWCRRIGCSKFDIPSEFANQLRIAIK